MSGGGEESEKEQRAFLLALRRPLPPVGSLKGLREAKQRLGLGDEPYFGVDLVWLDGVWVVRPR